MVAGLECRTCEVVIRSCDLRLFALGFCLLVYILAQFLEKWEQDENAKLVIFKVCILYKVTYQHSIVTIVGTAHMVLHWFKLLY